MIHTEISIAAAPSRVWAVLMDFPSYPGWNPFVTSIDGKAAVGETLRIVVKPPGGSAQTFKPEVIALEPNRLFVWRGSLPIPGLFVGEHRFELHEERGGTRLIHSETFSGLLIPLLKGTILKAENGFKLMNQALKDRVETLSAVA